MKGFQKQVWVKDKTYRLQKKWFKEELRSLKQGEKDQLVQQVHQGTIRQEMRV